MSPLSVTTTVEILVLGAVGLLWAGLFGYVVVSRAVYDARKRVVDAACRIADRRIAVAGPGAEIEIDRILRRLSVKKLLGAVADKATGTPVARVFSRHLVRRAGPEVGAMLGQRSSTRSRWQRAGALRVAALGRMADAPALLQSAVLSPDEETRAAGVQILGELETPEAQEILIESLRDGTFARSRVAAQLDDRAPLSPEVLRPLLEDRRSIARYWGAKLLAPLAHEPEATDALLVAAADDESNVRAGAADSLGRGHSARGTQVLMALLRDRSAPVRIHAARSLGRRRAAGSAMPLAPLLRDSNWSVRRAAKRALEQLGRAAVPAVSPLLEGNDEFARNGAAEVLQNLGVVRDLVDDIADSSDDDGAAATRAAAELTPILNAGGDRFTTSALDHLDDPAGRRARSLVDGAS